MKIDEGKGDVDFILQANKDLCTLVENLENFGTINIEEYMEVEHEKNSKELGVYKKALELACEAIVDRNCTGGIACSRNNCELYAPCFNEIEWEKYFIQKAREE